MLLSKKLIVQNIYKVKDPSQKKIITPFKQVSKFDKNFLKIIIIYFNWATLEISLTSFLYCYTLFFWKVHTVESDIWYSKCWLKQKCRTVLKPKKIIIFLPNKFCYWRGRLAQWENVCFGNFCFRGKSFDSRSH